MSGKGTLLVGYGNTARRDDGVGPFVVDGLMAEGFEGAVTQQMGAEMAADWPNYARVVLVDASDGGAPVMARRVRLGAGNAPAPTTHHTGPEALLELCRLFGEPPELWLVTVRGEDFSFGEGLGEAVRRRAEAARVLARQLAGG